MSMMLCKLCDRLVNTDDDPDSLYVPKHDGDCICRGCRNSDEELLSEFER